MVVGEQKGSKTHRGKKSVWVKENIPLIWAPWRFQTHLLSFIPLSPSLSFSLSLLFHRFPPHVCVCLSFLSFVFLSSPLPFTHLLARSSDHHPPFSLYLLLFFVPLPHLLYFLWCFYLFLFVCVLTWAVMLAFISLRECWRYCSLTRIGTREGANRKKQQKKN